MGMHEERTKRWRQWTAADARRELELFAGSGKTLAAYARERGITPQRLSWWRKRLTSEPRCAARKDATAKPIAPMLVPAVVKGPVPTMFSAPAVTVQLPGGVLIEFSDTSAASAEWASQLVVGMMRAAR